MHSYKAVTTTTVCGTTRLTARSFRKLSSESHTRRGIRKTVRHGKRRLDFSYHFAEVKRRVCSSNVLGKAHGRYTTAWVSPRSQYNHDKQRSKMCCSNMSGSFLRQGMPKVERTTPIPPSTSCRSLFLVLSKAICIQSISQYAAFSSI